MIPGMNIDALADFGLVYRQEIKFRSREGANATKGIAMGVNRDGSIAIWDTEWGSWRSIYPELIEVQKIGPRGGRPWVKLTIPEKST